MHFPCATTLDPTTGAHASRKHDGVVQSAPYPYGWEVPKEMCCRSLGNAGIPAIRNLSRSLGKAGAAYNYKVKNPIIMLHFFTADDFVQWHLAS